jgi:hypothetical protein
MASKGLALPVDKADVLLPCLPAELLKQADMQQEVFCAIHVIHMHAYN